MIDPRSWLDGGPKPTGFVPDHVDVAALLALGRFDLSTEASIQLGIDRLFAEEYGPDGYGREVRLSARDRVDFMVCGVAVEVKHRRAVAAPTVLQLARYAEHERVTSIVLATGWPMNVPVELNGKPVRVVSLGRAWL